MTGAVLSWNGTLGSPAACWLLPIYSMLRMASTSLANTLKRSAALGTLLPLPHASGTKHFLLGIHATEELRPMQAGRWRHCRAL